MEIDNFSVIALEFHARVSRIVWCTFSTVDRQGRPRSRILHPIWEDHHGFVATGRHSHKAKHLAHNPYVSLTYWDPDHKQVYIDCKAAWADDQTTKTRVWELFRSTAEPLGYDPAIIWPGPEHESFGVISLTPWRIELSALGEGGGAQVWHNKV